MYPLMTPFGEIDIKIDGEAIKYKSISGRKSITLMNESGPITKDLSDLLGRYQIVVEFIPDGKIHELSCTIGKTDQVKGRELESSERLSLLSFYSQQRESLAIGLYGEPWTYYRGELIDSGFDYDIQYLEYGLSYVILEETKTTEYLFGIAWIDDLAYDAPLTDEWSNRDIQTFFGADPSFEL